MRTTHSFSGRLRERRFLVSGSRKNSRWFHTILPMYRSFRSIEWIWFLAQPWPAGLVYPWVSYGAEMPSALSE